MPDSEMMREAAAEIRGLRRRLEVLEAKNRVFEIMASLHSTYPREEAQGMSPDVAWKLEQRAIELETELNVPVAVPAREVAP